MLICHQSLKVLHFVHFNIKFLLTKLFFLGIIFSQETNHMIWWPSHFWFLTWPLLPFPSFCLTKGFKWVETHFFCLRSLQFKFLFLCYIFLLEDVLTLINQTALQCLEDLYPIHPLHLPLYPTHVFPHYHFFKLFHQEI